jgi:hypothetical protein
MLYAIKNGVVPSTVGIWTLGNPLVQSALNDHPLFSKRILSVMQQMDELHALQILAPDSFGKEVDKLIDSINNGLLHPNNQDWNFEWVKSSER